MFGQGGLQLSDCTFGECVAQNVIDTTSSSSSTTEDTKKSLSGGVIAGLAVVGALVLLAVLFLIWGFIGQRRARRGRYDVTASNSMPISWKDVSYFVSTPRAFGAFRRRGTSRGDYSGTKRILDNVSGYVAPGQMMAILGPSGAGKTTLVEILAGKQKTGRVSGLVSPAAGARIAFVPQQDVLPPTLTVRESLAFAAALRLPE